MSLQHFGLVWHYVTNCWSFNSNSYTYDDYFLYRCTFGAKSRSRAGHGVRAKKRRAVSGYPAYMKMTPEYTGEYKKVVGYRLQRCKPLYNNDHSLETADVVAYQSSLGNYISDVRDTMRAKHVKVAEQHSIDAGGRKLDYQQVANIMSDIKRGALTN